MAKNRNRNNPSAPSQKPQGVRLSGISRRGWKVIGAGAGAVAAGFIVLSFTDPAGQNWASNLCPFLILGGYATIGAGIMTPDPGEDSDEQPELK